MGNARRNNEAWATTTTAELAFLWIQPQNYGVGCLENNMPTSCSRVRQALDHGEGKRLEVYSQRSAEAVLLGIGISLAGTRENDGKAAIFWVVGAPGSQSSTVVNPPNTGIKAALKPEDAKKYEQERQNALYRITLSGRCRDFLTSHGINLRDLAAAIRSQRPFDGKRSTITRGDAGLVDPTNPTEVRYSNVEVRRSFRSEARSAETAIYPGGVLGPTMIARSDVYYRPSRINDATIIHEALHSLFGENDPQLQLRLGLSTEGFSENITQALRDNGCAEEE